jgi:hypothetical protein
MMRKITIYADGVWAGEGKLMGGTIEDCAAILGGSQDAAEAIYERIEDEIAAGDESEARDGDGITIDGVSYSWTLGE